MLIELRPQYVHIGYLFPPFCIIFGHLTTMAGSLKIGDDDFLDFIQLRSLCVFTKPANRIGRNIHQKHKNSTVNASYAEIEICNVRGVKYHELATC